MMQPDSRWGAGKSGWRHSTASAMPRGSVRRWLTILLLVFLPLQFSWAALSAHSHHLAAATAQDVGHHARQHKLAADREGSGDLTVAGDTDADSGACHAQGCAGAIFGAVPWSTVSASSGTRIGYQVRLPPPPPTSLPERPNWTDLA